MSDNEYLCPNCSAPLTTQKLNSFYGYAPDTRRKKNTGGVVLTVVMVLVLFFGLLSVGLYFFGGHGQRGDGGTDSDTQSKAPSMANTEDPTVSVMFKEGLRAQQIAELLEEKGVCAAQDFLDACEQMDISDYSFAQDIEQNRTERYYRLEGYLFPDTYEFFRGEAPESAVKRFLNNFEKRVSEEIRSLARDRDMTVDQAVALASIITKEAGKSEEMPMVSSVFHNRIKTGQKLQSDPTFWYPYHNKAAVPDNLRETFRSRYNTYDIKGIPPGAICNPGLDAIEAAVKPTESEYYYFVYDINGKYYFAKTWEEHKANVKIIEQIKAVASSKASQ